jgi:PleD family two-component response regulator
MNERKRMKKKNGKKKKRKRVFGRFFLLPCGIGIAHLAVSSQSTPRLRFKASLFDCFVPYPTNDATHKLQQAHAHDHMKK